jgi:hypothetical protein
MEPENAMGLFREDIAIAISLTSGQRNILQAGKLIGPKNKILYMGMLLNISKSSDEYQFKYESEFSSILHLGSQEQQTSYKFGPYKFQDM